MTRQPLQRFEMASGGERESLADPSAADSGAADSEPAAADARWSCVARCSAGSRAVGAYAGDLDEPARFRLSSLLLTTALIGLCLAVGRVLPLAGVTLAVLAGPAFIRTALASRLRHDDSSALLHSIWQMLVFLESLLVVTLLAVAGVLTFSGLLGTFAVAGVWLARNWLSASSGVLVVSLFSGLAVAVTATLMLLAALARRLWPVRQCPVTAKPLRPEPRLVEPGRPW